MLYKVDVRTPRGDLLTLQFDDISDGYIVGEITGLDPVKATVVETNFANLDGTEYQSSNRPSRNIVFSIEFDTGAADSVSTLRDRLYPFFISKQAVSLTFYREDGLTVTTSGRVESMEAPLFTDEPKADISIICFDPDFIDPTPVVMSEFSTDDTGTTDIVYKGTSDVGMLFTINVAHPMTELTIYQTTPSGDVKSLDFAGDLVADDVLTISTVRGNKFVTLTRGGIDSSALYGVSPQSSWLTLEHGTNAMRVYATDGGSPATITYTNRYGGL